MILQYPPVGVVVVVVVVVEVILKAEEKIMFIKINFNIF